MNAQLQSVEEEEAITREGTEVEEVEVATTLDLRGHMWQLQNGKPQVHRNGS